MPCAGRAGAHGRGGRQLPGAELLGDAVSGPELARTGALDRDDCAAKAPILLGDMAQRRAQLANESQTRNSAKNSFPL